MNKWGIFGVSDMTRATIAPSKWGRDHWTTLLYAEYRAVDFGGHLDHKQMRCSLLLHTGLAHLSDSTDLPTKLRDSSLVANHDDYSCLEDAWAAGLVLLEYLYSYDGDVVVGFDAEVPQYAWYRTGARVTLTDKGWRWAGRLRQLKSESENANYTYEAVARLDAESIGGVAVAILDTDDDLATICHKFGYYPDVSPSELEAAIIAYGGVEQCSGCGFWFRMAECEDGYCENCLGDLSESYGDDRFYWRW